MKTLLKSVTALLFGMSAPVLIWVGAGSALYQSRRTMMVPKKALPNWACSIDTDCPPGFECIDGYCVPGESE